MRLPVNGIFMKTNLNKWRLRWSFFYTNGKYKYGMWDIQSPHKHEQWNSLTRDRLERVDIHGKRLDTGEIFTLFSCPAENFDEIRWVGSCSIPAFGLGNLAIKVPATIYAIQIKTIKDGILQFTLTGKKRKELNNGNYHYDSI